MLHSTAQHNYKLRSKVLVALFASLTLGLSACGGGGSKKAEPAKTGFIATDFEKQVYVSKEDNSATTFLAGQTGIEYSDEGEGNGGTYPFTWAIDNEKLDVTYNTGGRHYTYAFKSADDNKYVGVLDDSDESPYDHILYKAKPLNLANLDGKILAFDVSDDSDCSARTIKITGNAVNMKEVCTGGSSEILMTLSTVSNLDNTLEFGFTEDGTPRTLMMVLIEGSIAQSGTVAFIHKKNNIFTAVELETITATDKEAEAPATPVNPKFKVVNKKLVMKSTATTSNVNSEIIYYGAKDDVHFDSLEGDIALTADKITGDARSRIGLVLKMSSTTDTTEVYMAIDNRASGIKPRAYLTINGVETTIPGVHKQITVTKGTAYKFKMETPSDSPVLRLTLGSSTADIPFSSIPSGMKIDKVRFINFVKNPQAGDFSQGTVDNIVLKFAENGTSKTRVYNFDDGKAPKPDAYFDDVYGSTP